MFVYTSSDVSVEPHSRQYQTAQRHLQNGTSVGWLRGIQVYLLFSGIKPEGVGTNGEMVGNFPSSLNVRRQRMDLQHNHMRRQN